jgi:PAS domain S-box-containing protein
VPESDATPTPTREQTLRELQELRHALDESAIMATTDAAGTITSVNDRFCRISQYSRTELLGQNHRIINSGHHPKEFFQDLWRTISAGKVWRGDIRNRAKDGSFYWVGTTIVPFLDGTGRPWQHMAIRFEITERKRAEAALEASRAELEARAQALARSNADLEQFAYVASHDLQEPLRMVSSFTKLLARRYTGRLDADADEFIRYASEGAETMQAMIRDLLAFSRLNAPGSMPRPVPLDETLDAALLNLRAALDEAKPVLRRAPLPTVPGEPGQLTQLFQNLLGNALKFRDPARPLEIDVDAAREGHAWRIRVKDNGPGIDPKYQEQIFTLFQRLHSKGEYPGSGIGLAFCKRIVQRHGGRIAVDSAPGAGATFHFTLPAEWSPA